MHSSFFRELWDNRKMTLKMAVYNINNQYNQTYLKLIWTVLNPVLQAMTYWVVFFIGLKTGSPVNDIPYVLWMLAGLVPWFYVSAVLTSGLNSIVASSSVIKNMHFPVSIIPLSSVLTETVLHLFFLLVYIVIQLCYGITLGINALFLIYYMFAAVMFLTGYTYFMSAVNVFVRDLSRVMSILIRFIFFVTPICWFPKGNEFDFWEMINPVYYIVDGYRTSMLYNEPVPINSIHHLYFWAITTVFLVLGYVFHNKLKKHFADYL